jgi:HK97 family phage major capsid protein
MQKKAPKGETRTFEQYAAAPATRSLNLKLNSGSRSLVIDEEARTVELAFSSETPVSRWFGDEILDHSPEAVDLSRLMSGGALLMDHDTRDQIGVVESVRIDEDRVARAVVRFGRSARAKEIFDDVVDGIRTNISVGYMIQDWKLTGERDGAEIYTITRWTPYEISFVSVPADPTVGVGRNFDPKGIREEVVPEDTGDELINEAVSMEADEGNLETEANTSGERTAETTTETPAENKENTTMPQANTVDSVVAAERARIAGLNEIGKRFGAMDLAERCIADGSDVATLNALILERKGFDAKPAEGSTSLGMTERDLEKFSIVRLLNALANPQDGHAQREAKFELEVSAEAARKLKREAKGAIVPFEVLAHKRNMLAGTAAAGGNLIANELKTGSFIDMLRNKLAINQAGATILSGLEGNLAIPRQTGGAAAFWLAENGQPSETSATFDQVALTPKTVGAFTEISRKLLQQASMDVEAFVTQELVKTLALEIDRIALNGSGTANQPRGILNVAGIGAVAGGTNGAAPTLKHIVDLETAVADANADVGTMKYLTNARVRGKLKQTEVAANSGKMLWQDGNTLNGYDAIVSNQVPKNGTKGTSSGVCSTIVFGNFSDLVIGMWGGLDIQVNPYSLDTSGAVRITAFQDVDTVVRQPASFAAMTDALTV